MNNLCLGHHINISSGFVSSAEYAHSTNSNVYQIFLGNPKAYVNKRHTNKELIDLKDNLDKFNIKLSIHGSLILNFCHPIGSKIYDASVQNLVNDLIDANVINKSNKVIGLVIHMGKNIKALNISNSEAISNYAKGIKHVLDSVPNNTVPILLETGAGQGTEICTSLLDLGLLYNSFQDKYKSYIKICIDTCHIFASGHNLSDVSYIDLLKVQIDVNLNWNNIRLIHLNDSKTPVCKRVDRHADIGKGYINILGLKKFILLCNDFKIPIVLETPEDMYDDVQYKHIDQMKMIRKWMR